MKKAVLLLPAALAPMHKDHVKILEIAKEILEKKGLEVTHAYLLPSSEKYVSNKTGGHFLDSLEIRVNLCRLATKDNDWINVLDWGMASGNQACSLIKKTMHPDTNVFIVAKADTSRNKKNPFLIVVPRSEDSASSTKVREAIFKKERKSLYELVGKEVGDEIIKLSV